MTMTKLTAGASLLAFILSGCASLPPSVDERGISVRQVVDAVQCELWQAAEVSKRNKGIVQLSRFVAGINLNLSVVDTKEASAGLTRDWAFSQNTAQVVASISMNGVSTRGTQLEFGVDLGDFKGQHKCTEGTGLPWAKGSLGLAEWLATVIGAIDSLDIAGVTKTVYKIEFEITTSGGISIKAVTPHFSNLGAGISGNRKDTHTLTVSLEPKVEAAGPKSAPGKKKSVAAAIDRAQKSIREYNLRQIKSLIIVQ